MWRTFRRNEELLSEIKNRLELDLFREESVLSEPIRSINTLLSHWIVQCRQMQILSESIGRLADHVTLMCYHVCDWHQQFTQEVFELVGRYPRTADDSKLKELGDVWA